MASKSCKQYIGFLCNINQNKDAVNQTCLALNIIFVLFLEVFLIHSMLMIHCYQIRLFKNCHKSHKRFTNRKKISLNNRIEQGRLQFLPESIKTMVEITRINQESVPSIYTSMNDNYLILNL